MMHRGGVPRIVGHRGRPLFGPQAPVRCGLEIR